MKNKSLLIIVLIVVGAFSRIIPHPDNFTAIGAMAILGGLYFDKKYIAFSVPIIAMFISDLYLGYKPILSIYIAFLFIIPIGIKLRKKITYFSIFNSSIIAAILFFLVTNFLVWTNSSPLDGIYYCEPTLMGLIKCYTQAIPFFMNTLLGNIFFCFSLFGLYEVISKRKFIYINS
ncbi:MAG: hypothetical protein CMP74_03615 [Flavobacteriales bacterium]|nr:hypothetical protein [Flavobacteriales bacterium]